MPGDWGGKYGLSLDAYHAVPAEWQVPSLIRAHEALGGTYRLQGRAPRVVWYELADGIRAGDAAYAAMTEGQRRTLCAHFLELLEKEERCHEFREYLDLWSDIADDAARERALAIAAAQPDSGFAQLIVRRMTHAGMPAAPQPRKAPRWFYSRRRSPILGLHTRRRERWVDERLVALKRAADDAGSTFAAAKREWLAAEFEYRVDAARHGGKPRHESPLAARREAARRALERARGELEEASRVFRASRQAVRVS